MPYVKKPPVNIYKRLPVVGPWISRLGFIEQIWANTALFPKPEIWVKAAFHALPRLLYLPVKPYLWALEWDRLTRRNHRGKKGIAKALTEFAPKAPILATEGWQVFQATGDFVLKAEWYFMVVDRTTEFAVNWTSLAFVYDHQNFPGQKYIDGHITDGIIYCGAVEFLVGPFTCVSSEGPQLTGTITMQNGESGQVYCSVDVTPIRFLSIPPPSNFKFYIKDHRTGATIASVQHDDAKPISTGGADAAFQETYNSGARAYSLYAMGSGGFVQVNDIQFGLRTFHTGTKGLTFDP